MSLRVAIHCRNGSVRRACHSVRTGVGPHVMPGAVIYDEEEIEAMERRGLFGEVGWRHFAVLAVLIAVLLWRLVAM